MREMFGLKVYKKKDEALDAVTLIFDLPTKELQRRFQFKAGQFIGITQNIGNEVVHRSYSLSSNPHEHDRLAISVKKIKDGRMSTCLVQDIKEGDELMVTPPAGNFYKEPETKRHHVMFAAGSGITPMMSILKHLAFKKTEDPVTLFYWNQSQKTSMFLEELKDWAKSKKNFNLFLAFTKNQCGDDNDNDNDDDDDKGQSHDNNKGQSHDNNKGQSHDNDKGQSHDEEVFCFERVNDENLKSCYYNWSTALDMPVFYLCGPEAFMDTVESFLSRKGYDGMQIRKESFLTGVKPFASKGAPGLKEDELLVGDLDQAQSQKGGVCSAVIDGSSVEVTVEEDETILEALLRAGETPPYSCMEGTCMACQCKVIEGVVEMPKEGFLSDEEINEKNILSCQAFVRSSLVKLDFDDF